MCDSLSNSEENTSHNMFKLYFSWIYRVQTRNGFNRYKHLYLRTPGRNNKVYSVAFYQYFTDVDIYSKSFRLMRQIYYFAGNKWLFDAYP